MSTDHSPRPVHRAATVVVARRQPDSATEPAGQPEILMLRRSAKSSFMPDAYVFPGGRVDAQDGPADSAASFVEAARRECQEESGLTLNGDELRWFDTWQTPSGEGKRRFLARFYYAEVDAHVAANARADGHETHDEFWARPEVILHRWRNAELDLPPPTACVLLQLAASEARDQLLQRTPQELARPILPKAIERNGHPTIVMPHAEAYATTPGEGQIDRPERTLGLPDHFIRVDGVWRPQETA